MKIFSHNHQGCTKPHPTTFEHPSTRYNKDLTPKGEVRLHGPLQVPFLKIWKVFFNSIK